MRYQHKPTLIEATRWFKNGDHPDDACETFTGSDGQPFKGEGKVVRYYRRPDVAGDSRCYCTSTMHEHGWIDEPDSPYAEGTRCVCPGDYVITDRRGNHYSASPEVFDATFEPAITDPAGLEAKINAKLAELAPPGTPNTLELQSRVRAELATLVAGEFKSYGPMGLLTASLLAGLATVAWFKE